MSDQTITKGLTRHLPRVAEVQAVQWFPAGHAQHDPEFPIPMADDPGPGSVTIAWIAANVGKIHRRTCGSSLCQATHDFFLATACPIQLDPGDWIYCYQAHDGLRWHLLTNDQFVQQWRVAP